ncbi:MAG: hypothetical protein M1818_004102 [Claussenomyces sp. TS43310]|nr:MAG: hypothetical protein M1818_004102 [Claussenomyces sp. TS43310]
MPSRATNTMKESPKLPLEPSPYVRHKRKSPEHQIHQWLDDVNTRHEDIVQSKSEQDAPDLLLQQSLGLPRKKIRLYSMPHSIPQPSFVYSDSGYFDFPGLCGSDITITMENSAVRSTKMRYYMLRYLKPKIHVGPPPGVGSAMGAKIPPSISTLIRQLSEDAADPVLSAAMISKIMKLSPTEFFAKTKATPRAAVVNSKYPLQQVSKVFEQARTVYHSVQSEQGWYLVVAQILTGFSAKAAADPPPFTICEPLTHQGLHPELLPQHNGSAIPGVRVDFLLQFNPGHDRIAEVYEPVLTSQPMSFSMSAFVAAAAEKTFTCATVEVKTPSGDCLEAAYQSSIAAAAILERLKGLDQGKDEKYVDKMPVLSWIVHGHFWYLQLTYWETNGSISASLAGADSVQLVNFQALTGANCEQDPAISAINPANFSALGATLPKETQYLSVPCTRPDILVATLNNSLLLDSLARIGAIVNNVQFQFDNPPAQLGSI